MAGVLASFALLEEAAFRRGRHPTLSSCLSRWLGCSRPAWRRFIGPGLFGAGWFALTVHVFRYKAKEAHR